MNQYKDETIAKLKTEIFKRNYASIYEDGVYINNRLMKFVPRSIGAWAAMYLPEEFIEMPEEIQRMKYPSESRPQMIYTSLDTTVNFAFNMVRQEIQPEQAESLADQLMEVIGRANPAAVFYREENETLSQEQPIYMFDFKSYGIDEPLYHMMCITTLRGMVVHGTFSCMERDAEEWQEAAWEAFQSITDTKEEEQT